MRKCETCKYKAATNIKLYTNTDSEDNSYCSLTARDGIHDSQIRFTYCASIKECKNYKRRGICGVVMRGLSFLRSIFVRKMGKK